MLNIFAEALLLATRLEPRRPPRNRHETYPDAADLPSRRYVAPPTSTLFR